MTNDDLLQGILDLLVNELKSQSIQICSIEGGTWSYTNNRLYEIIFTIPTMFRDLSIIIMLLDGCLVTRLTIGSQPSTSAYHRHLIKIPLADPNIIKLTTKRAINLINDHYIKIQNNSLPH